MVKAILAYTGSSREASLGYRRCCLSLKAKSNRRHRTDKKSRRDSWVRAWGSHVTSLRLSAATCKVGILYNLPSETTGRIKTLLEVPPNERIPPGKCYPSTFYDHGKTKKI